MGGADKALVLLSGRPLIAFAAERLEPQVEALAVSANGDGARFAACGLPVLPDTVPGSCGPLAGILAGLDWAAGRGAQALVSVAVDTPFFPCDLVPRLCLAATGGGAAVAASGGRVHPVFGLWPVALRGVLRTALAQGTRRVEDWVCLAGAERAVAQFPVADLDPFFNINTAADLAAAQMMQERRA